MKLVGHITLHSFVHPSILSFLHAFLCIRALHARVLKMFKWVSHEKIADIYDTVMAHCGSGHFDLVSKISQKVFKLLYDFYMLIGDDV